MLEWFQPNKKNMGLPQIPERFKSKLEEYYKNRPSSESTRLMDLLSRGEVVIDATLDSINGYTDKLVYSPFTEVLIVTHSEIKSLIVGSMTMFTPLGDEVRRMVENDLTPQEGIALVEAIIRAKVEELQLLLINQNSNRALIVGDIGEERFENRQNRIIADIYKYNGFVVELE